jgi:hypothetical protein
MAEIKRRTRAKSSQRADSAPSTPQPAIPAIERELLELILLEPTAFREIASDVDASQLTSAPARRIYDMCLRLAAADITPDFDRLLTEIDDPALKSLLVEIDEQAHARAARGAVPRREELLEQLRWRERQREHREQVAALADRRLDAKEELALIERMMHERRIRQGISKPTDG